MQNTIKTLLAPPNVGFISLPFPHNNWKFWQISQFQYLRVRQDFGLGSYKTKIKWGYIEFCIVSIVCLTVKILKLWCAREFGADTPSPTDDLE